MPEPIDYLSYIRKLVERSDEGKLPWKQTYDPTTFSCTVEGEFVLEVRRYHYENEDRIAFEMKDAAGNNIFTVYGPEDGYGEPSVTLRDAYESARRIALDIDSKLNRLSDLLNRM